jgi:hypothetical protein
MSFNSGGARLCPAWRKWGSARTVEPGTVIPPNLLVGVWKESLIVRLGSDNYDDALLEPHVREFDITGRPMKGWVLVGPEGVQNDEQLTDWIERPTRFVRALPAKGK